MRRASLLCDRKPASMPFTIPLIRTERTEEARLELREHIPTVASVERLALIINGGVIPSAVIGRDGRPEPFYVQPDPAHLGQRMIRHRLGWGWTCLRCKRESEGQEGLRPIECPRCRANARYLLGHEMPQFYLADAPHGVGNHDGGIESVNLFVSFGWWLESVAPARPVVQAVDAWVLGMTLRQIRDQVHRSHEWVRVAVEAVRQEWERAT